MRKTEEAKAILGSLGFAKSSAERAFCSHLIGAGESWPESEVESGGASTTPHRGHHYKPNSRETIRRQTLHQFEQACIAGRNSDDPSRPTNSGNTVYRLTEEAAAVLRCFGTRSFDKAVAGFLAQFGSLRDAYLRRREGNKIPLQMAGGSTIFLSPGVHNRLQVAVIEKFGPRFAPGAHLLYLGDTASKHTMLDATELTRLSVPITEHDKLPDVIFYWRERNWTFLIEAVTSHGPVSPKRHREIETMLKSYPAERVYVTAFLDMRTFRKYAGDIAWETEVGSPTIPTT